MTAIHFDLTCASPSQVDRRPKVSEVHGHRLVDDYAWLRADNWQEVLRDPKVLPADIREVLERENASAAAVLRPSDPS